MILDSVAAADRFADLTGLLESCAVDGSQVDFLTWGHYRPEYWRNYWHSHSFHEICLAYRGAGRFSSGRARYEVGRGSVFIARPGDVHEIESSRAEPLGIAFWGFTVRWNSVPRGWWSGLARPDGPVVSERAGSLPALITALAAEAVAPVSGYDTTLKALGRALVVETGRAFAPAEDLVVDPIRRDLGLRVVDSMQRHLRDNLARAITVRDVAAAAHLSERHAERLFRQQTGESIMSALRELRLERAAQLLLDPILTITEVARACGYSGVRPFATAFRRRYGRTPSRHRSSGGTEFV